MADRSSMEAKVKNDAQKVRIACDFLLHAAPGEFNEVFNDVRLLVNNEQLIRDGCAPAVAQYNKDQFMPVRLAKDGVEVLTLVTPYNELVEGRFYDPKSGLSFRYDHLRKEATDAQKAEPPAFKAEPWRRALQKAADTYTVTAYKSGVSTVFGRLDTPSGLPAVCLCIEAHRFQPKNYWNGRWRSQWAIVVGGNPVLQKEVELRGQIKVQVHYYEDGNVQLVSSKECTVKIHASVGGVF